jgi:Leucine-rich repeat (LRR) protein
MVLLAANLLSVKGQTTAKIVKCEKIKVDNWVFLGDIKTCFMDRETSMDSDGFQISTKDETVKGLLMSWNKKIKFLPQSPSKMFENLIGYSALHCLIKQISYENFQGLDKLERLALNSNEIETVPSNTFKDLKALKHLDLGENIFFTWELSLISRYFR